MERRYFNTTTRAQGEGDFPQEIAGTGAVVGVTTDLGYCEEDIHPDAFKSADLSDVLVCFNHDLDVILGRTIAGTAQVEIDEAGNLVYTANKLDPQNPEIQAPIRYVQRGEVSKSSFMFEIDAEMWDKSDKYGDYGKRTIMKIGKVYECGPVTLPAYNETESYAREKDGLMQARSKWIETNQTPNDHLGDDEELRAAWLRFYELTVK
jgi:HK97 family phage prohead protease